VEKMAVSRFYIEVWAILVAATIMEVVVRSLSYIAMFIVAGIISIAWIKAILIALYFQGLKKEPFALSAIPLAALILLFLLLLTAIFSVSMGM
jgi:hypothetical protein